MHLSEAVTPFFSHFHETGADHAEAPASWLDWHWEPTVALGLVLLAGAYLLAVGPYRDRFPGSARVSGGRVALFLGGLLVGFLALQGPIDVLSDRYLFTVHMVQHMLLALLMAPLLLLGTPAWLVRPLLRPRAVFRVAHFLTRAPVAFLLFNLNFALWHFPVFYEAALEHLGVHILQHLLMIFTGLLLWWPICGPVPELPRLSAPLQMLYLALQNLPGMLVGGAVTLTDAASYLTYIDAPRVWGIDPLMDQQIGGLLMWVGGHVVFLLVLTAVFFRWVGQEEARERAPAPSVVATPTAAGP